MSKKLDDVVITSALRTPIGTYKGSLKDLSADKLGALAIKEVIHKSNVKPDQIDEVIMGHVLTSGLGQKSCETSIYTRWYSGIKTSTYNKSSMWIRLKIYSFWISIN
jgi:acetyl-CoA acetyltransferase